MRRSMTGVLSCIGVALILTVSASCIATTVKGFTDREYADYRVRKVVIRVPNVNFAFGALLEGSFIKEFRNKGIIAESFLDMFPPTREWTNEQVASELIQKDFDSIMYVTLIGSDTNSQTIGFINSGSAHAYGNTASFSAVSVPVSRHDRYTSTRARLYEVKSARVIWVGDSSTHAGGLAFMADETQTESIAAEVVKSLQERGHIKQ